MRAADRSKATPPKALAKTGSKGASELVKARKAKTNPATRNKSFSFSAYKDDSVKTALEELFHGKCAYCETYYSTQAPVDVEHFRPKAQVEGAPDHPGYWWLAMVWENLLPSCIDCNRRRRQATPVPSTSMVALNTGATEEINTGKKDVFPVAGTRAATEGASLDLEEAYLLDPCRDDPDAHLAFHIDPDDMIALVLPRPAPGTQGAIPAFTEDMAEIADAATAAKVSARGAVSIQVYGLNRLGLVQARTRLLRHLEFLRQTVIEIDAVARKVEAATDPDIRAAAGRLDRLIDRILAEINTLSAPDAPYSAMVRQWCRGWLAAL